MPPILAAFFCFVDVNVAVICQATARGQRRLGYHLAHILWAKNSLELPLEIGSGNCKNYLAYQYPSGHTKKLYNNKAPN